jgi:hypothetical protein
VDFVHGACEIPKGLYGFNTKVWQTVAD